MFKRKPDYEKIIKEKIEELEEAREAYFNKTLENLTNIAKGDENEYHKSEYNTQLMNHFTYEIKLLRDILNEARA